jgi:hypothetical protein
MQRARTAKGKEGEIARIVAARQRHQADGTGHAIVGDAQDGGGRRFGIETEPLADLLQSEFPHSVQGHLVVDAQQAVGG